MSAPPSQAAHFVRCHLVYRESVFRKRDRRLEDLAKGNLSTAKVLVNVNKRSRSPRDRGAIDIIVGDSLACDTHFGGFGEVESFGTTSRAIDCAYTLGLCVPEESEAVATYASVAWLVSVISRRGPTSTTLRAAAMATAASAALPPARRIDRPASAARGCEQHTTPLAPSVSEALSHLL